MSPKFFDFTNHNKIISKLDLLNERLEEIARQLKGINQENQQQLDIPKKPHETRLEEVAQQLVAQQFKEMKQENLRQEVRKQVTRCASCNQIFRKSVLYRVLLEGKLVSTISGQPGQDITERVYLCEACVKTAGYKSRKEIPGYKSRKEKE